MDGSVSPKQLLDAITEMPAGICVVEVPSLRIVAASREFASLVGAESAESLVGTLPAAPAGAGLLPSLLPIWQAIARSGEVPAPTEVLLDGEHPRSVQIECRLLRALQGETHALVTYIRDLTHQRELERELDDSERQRRTLFEDNPHPMWIYDLETLRFLAVNDAAVHHYGYSRQEFAEMTIKDIRPPEDVPALLENVAHVTEGLDAAGVWRHRTRSGELLQVEITSHTIEFAGRRAEVVLAHDITERRKAEEELHRKTSELNALFAALPDLYLHVSAAGKVLNYRAGRGCTLDVPPENLVGRCLWEALPKEAAAMLQRGLREALEGGELSLVEYPIGIRGQEHVLEARIVPLPGNEGAIVIRDITERRRAEVQLRQSEANYRAIFDSANDAIFVHDIRTGAILDANRRMQEMYGYTADEIPGLGVADLSAGTPPYTQADAAAWIARAASGEPQVFEWLARRKDGSLFWVEVNLKRAQIGGKDCLLALVRDITERKRAEQELADAYQRVIDAEAERQRFYREVIRAVTGDKLRLVDAAEIPFEGPAALDVPLDTPQNYARLRHELGEISRAAGMSPEDASDLVLGEGEAATNAVKHAAGGRCTAIITDDWVVVRVADTGSGIRPEDLPGAVLLPGFSTRISLGMGYTIMLRLVDRVWLATSSQGTVVQLEKRIHPRQQPEPFLAAAWERL